MVLCQYYTDKIYEARHEILKLTTPVVQADIPETYFAPKDHEFEQAYCKTLASLLSNYPESPITPNMQMGSGFSSPFAQIQQKYATPNIPRLQQHNERFRMQQHQAQTNSFLSPFHHVASSGVGGGGGGGAFANDAQNTNISPRNHNSSANTSGYHSYSSSTNSLEQLYPPFQLANVAAATAGGLQHHQIQQQLHLQQQQQHNQKQHNLSATTDYSSPNSSNYLDGSNRRLSSSTSSLINDIDIRSPSYDMTVPHIINN